MKKVLEEIAKLDAEEAAKKWSLLIISVYAFIYIKYNYKYIYLKI